MTIVSDITNRISTNTDAPTLDGSVNQGRMNQYETHYRARVAIGRSGLPVVAGFTAMTGTADAATTYAVSTVTLAQLAARVKALQDALTTLGITTG